MPNSNLECVRCGEVEPKARARRYHWHVDAGGEFVCVHCARRNEFFVAVEPNAAELSDYCAFYFRPELSATWF